MPVFNNALAGAAGSGGLADYEISRSLRFYADTSENSYLSKTFSNNGNRKKYTISFWIKFTDFPSHDNVIFGHMVSGYQTQTMIRRNSLGYLEFGQFTGSWNFRKITQRKFNDPAAWYHIVWSVDTTIASPAEDRIKLYVNGVRETDWSTNTNPSQDLQTLVNSNVEFGIGKSLPVAQYAGNFYLADWHMVDGQALDANNFGKTDDYGVWQPKKFSGLYNTNGFHLDFSDPSDLGNDKAGNNNWTPNNFVGSAGLATAKQGMDVVTYTGNGGTNNVTGLEFQPDFVWIKNRDDTTSNMLFDSVRGVQKVLYSNATTEEQPASISLTHFNSNGFTVGSANEVNGSSDDMVAWCWKAGGSDVLNETGSIDSQVSANNTYGFSIVTWTGSGSNATIGHGLSSAPKFILLKFTGSSSNWSVYHSAIGNTKRLVLNSPGSTSTSSTYWQNTSPTSSVFSVGGDVNDSTPIVAYCWSEVPGFSKFGSYTGTGSAHHVELGFRPRYLVYKCSSSGNTNWHVYDSARNNGGTRLLPNLTAGDSGPSADSYAPTFTDTGFTVANVSDGHTNASGQTYIYAAFADKPDQTIIDSVIDTPTNYEASSGNNGGNYPTFNPLSEQYSTANHVLVNGNLQHGDGSSDKGNYALDISTMAAPPSGKWYWEMTTEGNGNYERRMIGVMAADANFAQYIPHDNSTDGLVGIWLLTGQKIVNGTKSSYTSSFREGNTVGVALDQDNQAVNFYVNGTAQGSISLPSNMQGKSIVAAVSSIYFQEKIIANFGQQPFKHTIPTGYKSLCTQNLPDPMIDDGSTAMDVVTYSGNGGTKSITGLNFGPDFVWIKARNHTSGHVVYDPIRGTSKVLNPDTSGGEADQGGMGLTAFNSDGFTVKDVGNGGYAVNGNYNYVGYAWDAGDLATNSSYDQSQDWLSLLTSSAGTITNPLYSFDGSTTTTSQLPSTSAGSYIQLGATLTNVTKLEVWQRSNSDVSGTGVQTYSNAPANQWVELTLTSSTVSNLRFEKNTNDPGIYAIRVNDKLLVQPGFIPAGSISSNVPSIGSLTRANQSAGFSIVSFEGSGSAATVAHGLNSEPHLMITKCRQSGFNWAVYHKSKGNTGRFLLNNGPTGFDTGSGAGMWNNTTPTSSVFSVGSFFANNNDFIAYCFTPVEGYSKFGIYTGNGSSDGPFIYTGFRPRFVMVLNTDTAKTWRMQDTARDPYNPSDTALQPDGNWVEFDNAENDLDILSNGFKPRNAHDGKNKSGDEYIYIAFAEHPFKTARAR